MPTSPSSTDMEELSDQAPNYEYFLSLIVNFSGQYSAKLSFLGKMDSEIFYQTKFGKYPYNISKEAVFYTDVKIELQIEDKFKELLQELTIKNPVIRYSDYSTPNRGNLRGTKSSLTYGRSPYKSLYEQATEYPEYIERNTAVQKELFSENSKITGEYLVREVLTSKDINALELKTNSTFSLVQAYTLIPSEPESVIDNIADCISMCIEDIVSTALKNSKTQEKYNDELISGYKKMIDYLLTFNKVDTNGFVTRFIIILLQEIDLLIETEEEFDMYLKERGLLEYYGE